MKAARIRLVVAAILLFAWLGYLGYLVLYERHPVVVSRSQIMASTHFVLAEVRVGADGLPMPNVEVKEDLRPSGVPLSGTIKVRNIREARIGGGAEAFKDPGPYLLMLSKADDGFELTPSPRSAGHERPGRPQPWAYRWDAKGVREQFEALVPKR
jgi:hypothetical protein